MKIIIATPRTGSTFYSRYLQLENPNMKCLDEFFQYQFYPSGCSHYNVTTDRLSFINHNHIIKILVGKEIDKRVWKKLINEHIPVTILKRKDIRRQILSFGLAAVNDMWVRYKTHVVGLRKKEIVADGALPYKRSIYSKELFDNITYRIKKIEKVQNLLSVDKVLFYEDIINLKYNKNKFTEQIMPIKQNPIDNDKMLRFFNNAEELDNWINNFIKTYQRKYL